MMLNCLGIWIKKLNISLYISEYDRIDRLSNRPDKSQNILLNYFFFTLFLKYSLIITLTVSGIVSRYLSLRSFSKTFTISSGNDSITLFIAILIYIDIKRYLYNHLL